ncbi:hypothetical protein [Nonomuraea sp. B1E8]
MSHLELAAGFGRARTMMRLIDVPRDLSITALSTLANLAKRLAELLAELSEADRAAIAAALPALERRTARALGATPPAQGAAG